jgi:phosphoribosylformimino-5-aminoimidazole carboxamide ribotide isomerase
MIIIPSIDIKNGKCVRLRKGNFHKSVIYQYTPQEMAKRFKKIGVPVIHVVDLDGAQKGQITQISSIADIVKTFSGVVQVGGGIRTKDDIDLLFAQGVRRVVIGTNALRDIAQTMQWINRYSSEAVALALDFNMIRGTPYVAIDGWQQTTTKSVWEVLDLFQGVIKHVLCTDISKDGMQIGPNFEFYKVLRNRYPLINIQASGGISSINDIVRLKNMGINNVILGKAIYESKIVLKEVINLVSHNLPKTHTSRSRLRHPWSRNHNSALHALPEKSE